MKDAPVEKKIEDFHLKEMDKDKLYKFLREMEFNRLLSSAISTYGEPVLEEAKINPIIILQQLFLLLFLV
jgi:DNA polymerase-1